MKHFPLALFVLLLSAHFSHADHKRGLFVGGAGSYVTNKTLTDDNVYRNDVDIPTFEFNFGYKFNSLLSIDLRSGRGINTRRLSTVLDPEPTTGFNEYNIDGYTSYYWRPELINREAKIYALLGYTNLDFIIDKFQNTAGEPTRLEPRDKLSVKGKSYGLGVGWFVNEKLTFNIEYRILIEKDDAVGDGQNFEFTSFTAGFDYRFDIPKVPFI